MTASAPAYPVIHSIHPRFRDTDGFGHINNAVYVTYIEVARQAYWERLDPGSDYGQVPFILAHVTMDFRSEALLREVLDVAIRCDWIGGKSFAFVYEIRDRATGRLVVEARSVQVCYDYDAKRSIAMPAWLRERITALEGRPLPAKP